MILKEEDFKVLIEGLELQKLRQGNLLSREDSPLLDEIHRAFHFFVVRWAHKHGSAYPHE